MPRQSDRRDPTSEPDDGADDLDDTPDRAVASDDTDRSATTGTGRWMPWPRSMSDDAIEGLLTKEMDDWAIISKAVNVPRLLEPTSTTVQQLEAEYRAFVERAVLEDIHTRRAVLILTTVATGVSGLSTLALLACVLVYGGGTTALAYLATALCLGLLAGQGLRRRRLWPVLLSAAVSIGTAYAGWRLAGSPAGLHAILTTATDGKLRQQAAVGAALGAALVAVLIVSALTFARVEAGMRRSRRNRRDVKDHALRQLRGVLVGMLDDHGEPKRPDRRRLVADYAAVEHAMKRLYRRVGGDHDVRAKVDSARAEIRHHGNRARWANADSDRELLDHCLCLLIIICTERYGAMSGTLPNGVPEKPKRPPRVIARRVVGATLPLVVIAVAFLVGLPLTKAYLIVFALLALSMYLFGTIVDPNWDRSFTAALRLLRSLRAMTESQRRPAEQPANPETTDRTEESGQSDA
jgi:hypothetical protein